MASGAENPLERVPSHDEAAEVGVLGAMLCDERAASLAVELLVKEDFYLPRHQILFDLFSDLHEAQPDLDILYVQSELERRGLVERVGGKDIIGRLVEDVPTAANIERYCRIVRDRAVERELVNCAGRIVQMCQNPDTSAMADGETPLVGQVEQMVFEIADRRAGNEPTSIQSVLDGVINEAERALEARREGRELECPAIATGFQDLDNKFAGGMWPGEVIIVAARPSVGKTTLSINIARKVACRPAEKNPIGVGVFSLEMPKEQVSKNILCGEARVSSKKMRTYSFDEEDYEVVQAAVRNLQNAPIFIDDTPGLTPAELRARARRLYHRDNVRLLVVDYLQLMQTNRRHDSREQAVAELSRQVKHLARELNIPIILLSQLRRPVQGSENKKPNLTDLRESGSIEQDADVVIMLHREIDENGVMTFDTTAIVQKNRNGETGDIKLSFFPDQFRFENYVPEMAGASDMVGV